jgi:glucokinase
MIALAIELGGTHSVAGIVQGERVIAKETVPSTGSDRLGPTLEQFASVLRKLAAKHQVAFRDCAGVSIAFCGLVDTKRARVLSTNLKYEDAPEIDLAGWARDTFGLHLRLENDARLALLGERFAGAARGFDDVVMMTIGTGIGGAAMMEGRLLRGKHFQAGCLGGHLPMNPRGRLCSCGAAGCAESEASTFALPGLLQSFPGFEQSVLAKATPLDYRTVFEAADAGDDLAQRVVAYSIDVWSALLVGLIHAYDPEVIVVGGGVMKRAARILPALEARAATAWTPWGRVQIQLAQCGSDAALLGAVPLLEEQL